MGTKGGSCRYRTPRCLRHNHFQSSRSCPSADEHPETMKMPEVTPLPNSPAPLPSPQGRGKRGRGERVRGIFKAVKRALWRVLRFQGRSDADAVPDIDLERCAELLRFELPSAIATPRAPCPTTASQEQTRASTEGTQGILGGRRGGCGQQIAESLPPGAGIGETLCPRCPTGQIANAIPQTLSIQRIKRGALPLPALRLACPPRR